LIRRIAQSALTITHLFPACVLGMLALGLAMYPSWGLAQLSTETHDPASDLNDSSYQSEAESLEPSSILSADEKLPSVRSAPSPPGIYSGFLQTQQSASTFYFAPYTAYDVAIEAKMSPGIPEAESRMPESEIELHPNTGSDLATHRQGGDTYPGNTFPEDEGAR
jgi:hypothetical protein